MPKRILYSRDAEKALKRMDEATSKRIRSKIRLLAAEPSVLANNIKAMKGSGGLMRLRIGDWRVIYRDEVILDVIRIAARGSAYD